MSRADRTGLGVAVAGHALLLAMLSLNLLKPPALPEIRTDPIDVSLVDETALQSTAPDPSPAAATAAAEAETTPAEPRPSAEQAASPPRPVEKVQPFLKKPVKAEPAKATPSQPVRRSGLSRDLLKGLTDSAEGTGTPAKTIGPAIASSIGAEIRRQLKPHWKSPTGADVEQLRTTLIVHLKRDGSIDGPPVLDAQTGVNESNHSQARVHVDQAIRAVRLAAPFKLPAEYYDAWKIIRPTFDKRLSQ